MTHDLWARLNERMYDYLSSVSLADLVEHQSGKHVAGVARLARRPEERCAEAGGAGSGLTEGKREIPIYLDYSATTPVDPRVAEKMIPYLTEQFGNPASRSHVFGWRTEEAVEAAREHVGALVNCEGKDIIWTSGATESINLALKGAAEFYKTKGKHLITVKTEHKATLDTCRELERRGFEVTYLEVSPTACLI
jgi:selenocysteine lyase/cysteine desulfurase